MQIYQNMTLDDLKTGMIVTVRGGDKYLILKNAPDHENIYFIGVRKNGWINSVGYDKNLKYNEDSTFDIVKVEVVRREMYLTHFEDHPEELKVIWEERPAVKLTVAEIEARLGYKIEIVSKEE